MGLNHFIPSRIREATRFRIPRAQRPGRGWRRREDAPSVGEEPLRRWVRLREKERLFSVLPAPRQIPELTSSGPRLLQPVQWNFPVDPKCLEERLKFLLGDSAKQQQEHAPLRYGQFPYSAELAMFERQLREARRIYRLQYVAKLQEVIVDERAKQKELLNRQRHESTQRFLQRRQKAVEEQKRNAVLAEKKRVDTAVTQAMLMSMRNSRKKQVLSTLASVENFQSGMSDKLGRRTSTRTVLDRNIFAPDIMRDLDRIDDEPEGATLDPSRRPAGAEQVYRKLLQMSFDILPEDAPSNPEEEEGGIYIPEAFQSTSTPEVEKARLMFQSFSDVEKAELLKQKIRLLRSMIADAENDKDNPMNEKRQKILSLLEETANSIESVDRIEK